MSEVTEKFYDKCLMKNNYYCVNYKWEKGFSKNQFIKSKDELCKFVAKYDDKDCYITFNPVKEPTSRKKENIKYINMLTLDFEYEQKVSPETKDRLVVLEEYTEKLLNHFEITNYEFIFSGNGFHVWIPLEGAIKIIEKDFQKYDLAYKDIIKVFQHFIDKENKMYAKIKVVDRKDFGGVLRIPGTKHTKTGRDVCFYKARDFKQKPNNKFRKMFLRYKNRKIQASHKSFKPKIVQTYDGELEDHPLVQLWYEDLPDGTDKHSTLVYALQSLVAQLDMQGTADVDLLTTELCQLHGISVNFNAVSTPMEMSAILFTAIKWCQTNGFDEYVPKFKKLLNNA